MLFAHMLDRSLHVDRHLSVSLTVDSLSTNKFNLKTEHYQKNIEYISIVITITNIY
jgi:hypothetical protein